MKSKILISLILLMTHAFAAPVLADENAADESRQAARYMRVNIDRVVIDTEGLIIASGSLAKSIDRLALVVEQLSGNSEALSAEEREILLQAVSSLDEASLALAALAKQLPLTAQNLSEQLPQVVRDARQPIADLSSGLQSARDGVFAITESLPQATANAKDLVNSALDSALVRLSTYSIILISVLSLALIGVMWFVYRQYLDPLAQKLDALTGAPEHFAEMSRYMKETSDNLLALQPSSATRLPAEDARHGDNEPRPDTGEAKDNSGSE